MTEQLAEYASSDAQDGASDVILAPSVLPHGPRAYRDVTQSEIGVGKDCLEKWRLRYGIGWRRKVNSARVLLGSLIHLGQEKHYWGYPTAEILLAIENMAGGYIRKHVDDIPEEKVPAYFQAKELAKQILLDYRAHYEGRDWKAAVDPHNGEPMIEYEIRVPVYTPMGRRSKVFRLRSKLDLVVEEEGELWVVDHKSMAEITDGSYEHLVLDQQARLYTWGLQVYLGRPVAGVIYNAIRIKSPGEPKINKNGEVSLAAIDTTLDRYLAVLERQDEYLRGLTDDDRKRIKAETKTKMGECIDFDAYAPEVRRLAGIKWFDRHRQRYTQTDLERAQMDAYQVTKQIATASWFYQNDSACSHWGGCPYRPLCMGLDPEKYFEIRPEGHDELSDKAKFHDPAGRGFRIGHPENQIQTLGFEGILDAVNG